jgi:hypothetical protein
LERQIEVIFKYYKREFRIEHTRQTAEFMVAPAPKEVRNIHTEKDANQQIPIKGMQLFTELC